MAVLLIDNIRNYVGLSSDSKPTGIPVGSVFFESDTRLIHKTYDGTNWIQFEEDNDGS